jgi:hypothetical protein
LRQTSDLENIGGTGKFKLTMDWKKSTNLTNFLDFPAPAGSALSTTPHRAMLNSSFLPQTTPRFSESRWNDFLALHNSNPS